MCQAGGEQGFVRDPLLRRGLPESSAQGACAAAWTLDAGGRRLSVFCLPRLLPLRTQCAVLCKLRFGVLLQ